MKNEMGLTIADLMAIACALHNSTAPGHRRIAKLVTEEIKHLAVKGVRIEAKRACALNVAAY